jgi:fumarate reductase subunit C
MNKAVDVSAGAALVQKARTNHWPARLDVMQSGSGLFLGLFMWGHMAFVSTILISEDAMWWVTQMFEGRFVFGQSYPGIVAAIVALVAMIFVLHGALAMRKLPANFQEYRNFTGHRKMLRHEDTTLWWVQAVTGCVLLLFATIHLYQMLMHPGDIGPSESADRVWTGRWWPLYLVLLFAVEIHGGVGLYRLAIKWGWFEGENPARSRTLLKRTAFAIILFFLTLGLLTLTAEMKVGYEHRHRAGERYVPARLQLSEPIGQPWRGRKSEL